MEENIAFGVPNDQIDIEQVKRVAQQAQIDTAIETLYPLGIRHRLASGGQRIGIARALYKQASVLVLDEATSAWMKRRKRL